LDKFSGKEKFYDYLDETNKLSEKDRMPDFGEILFYLHSFVELSSERQSGMGLSPIPFSKILLYQIHFCLDEDFVDIIRAIDSLYLKEIDSKTKKDKK